MESVELIRKLRSVVGQSPELEVVHECRTCGTSLDGGSGVCPACGSDDVVAIEIR